MTLVRDPSGAVGSFLCLLCINIVVFSVFLFILSMSGVLCCCCCGSIVVVIVCFLLY